MTREARQSRRGALAGIAGLAAVAGGWQLFLNRPRAFDFEPVPSAPGWRRLAAGPSSFASESLALVGIGAGSPAPAPLPPARLCDVLFRDGGGGGGGVPVAFFSDVFCPYCREMAPRLIARAGAGIALSWHELPLLGEASRLAARATTAAATLGRGPEFAGRLLRTPFRPTQSLVEATAVAVGLNPSEVVGRMASAEVDARLSESRSAARRLEIRGTPATVIGGTIVTGALGSDELDRLVALEAARLDAPC